MPAFSKEAYEAYDKKAKTAVRAHLDSKRVYTNIYEDYGPDIIAFHEYFHEVEIKAAWKHEWPEHWKTLHIPARKKKYVEEGRKGFFWVLNDPCTKAKVVKSEDLDDKYLEIVNNVRTPKGEHFFSIPIELTTEVILKNGRTSPLEI